MTQRIRIEPGETPSIDLPAGQWRLTLVAAPGQWFSSRLTDTRSGMTIRVNTWEDCIILTPRRLTLCAAPISEDQTVIADLAPLKTLEALGSYSVGLCQQFLRWPRSTGLGLLKQLAHGVILAAHRERKAACLFGEPPAGDLPVTHIGPEDTWLPGARERLLEAFSDPSITAVSWDSNGTGGEILPRPMPVLQSECSYASTSWACRPDQSAMCGPESAPEGTWLHLPEPLTHRRRKQVTQRGRPLPSEQTSATGTQAPSLAVIIPTRDRPHLLRACLESLQASRPAPDEVILVDHLTSDPEALRILNEAEETGAIRVKAEGEFNFSRLANLGAAQASGETLIFLNNDVTVLAPGWLGALALALERPGAGVAGAELHYPDGRLQHIGIANTPFDGPQHINSGCPSNDRGPFNLLDHVRECLAVTGACLATRRQLFNELGGFQEAFPEDYNDVDYCLRAREAGYLTLVTPGARLVHHETQTRLTSGDAANERRQDALQRLVERHPVLARPDPYFSPRWHSAPPLYRPQRS